MRVIGLVVAAIVPALLAVAVFAFPTGGSSENTASEKATVASTTDLARSLSEYVPPPHVRVIQIYGVTTKGR